MFSYNNRLLSYKKTHQRRAESRDRMKKERHKCWENCFIKIQLSHNILQSTRNGRNFCSVIHDQTIFMQEKNYGRFSWVLLVVSNSKLLATILGKPTKVYQKFKLSRVQLMNLTMHRDVDFMFKLTPKFPLIHLNFQTIPTITDLIPPQFTSQKKVVVSKE